MVKNIGIDIIEVERFRKIVARGDNFAQKVLTEKEFAHYQTLTEKRKTEYLGGRFAIKEAFSKALGTGIGKTVAFQDVETLNNELGAPITSSRVFEGKIFSTIAHDDHEIVAVIVLEEEPGWTRLMRKLLKKLSWRKK